MVETAHGALTKSKSRSRLASSIPGNSDDVREAILNELYKGSFVPGQRLVEPDLCTMFNSARSHVREALLRLQSEGLVDIVPFRGARIRTFGPREAHDIVLTMTALLALAARQAAERIEANESQEQLAEAMRNLREFGEADNYLTYAAAREKFYRQVMDIAGNEEIRRTCPLMQGHIVQRHLSARYNWATHQKRLPYYQAIFENIVAGNAREAEAAVWAFHEVGTELREY